jgi:hypothetical protein
MRRTRLTCFANISPTVPPATERKALPANPSRKRAMSIVWIFCANAHGIVKRKKKVNEHM